MFAYIIEGRTSLTNTDFVYTKNIDKKTYTTLEYAIKDSNGQVDISLPNSINIAEVSHIFIFTKNNLNPTIRNFVYFDYTINNGPIVNIALPFFDCIVLSFPKNIGITLNNFKIETTNTTPVNFEIKIVTIDASP